MQNESSDNEIYTDGRQSNELPVTVNGGEEDIENSLGQPDVPEEQWFSEKSAAASELVAGDPYTAALPPQSSITPVPSFGSTGNDEETGWKEPVPTDDPFVPLPYSPSSQADTVRLSGLAWSAGIAFFGSVAFTLFLGWIADLLLGISPWGIIGGILLGSIIGFMQFFRITARIFPNKDDGPEISPLMSRKDDE